jgi:large conductance mechanosensitive channel
MEILQQNVSRNYNDILNFILFGNPINIAIGMALGIVASKFGTGILTDVVQPVVHSFLTLFSKTGFNYTINGSQFNFGNVLEQIIVFVLFIVLLYFLIIKPVKNLNKKFNINNNTLQCQYCYTMVNPLATKCPACTSELNKE